MNKSEMRSRIDCARHEMITASERERENKKRPLTNDELMRLWRR